MQPLPRLPDLKLQVVFRDPDYWISVLDGEDQGASRRGPKGLNRLTFDGGFNEKSKFFEVAMPSRRIAWIISLNNLSGYSAKNPAVIVRLNAMWI